MHGGRRALCAPSASISLLRWRSLDYQQRTRPQPSRQQRRQCRRPQRSRQQRRQATSDMMLMSATIPAGSGAAGAACACPGTTATMKPATAIPNIVRNMFLSRIWPVARGSDSATECENSMTSKWFRAVILDTHPGDGPSTVENRQNLPLRKTFALTCRPCPQHGYRKRAELNAEDRPDRGRQRA